MRTQGPSPQQLQAIQLELEGKQADNENKRAMTQDRIAQSTERRARSIADVARAAHLASEAGLNAAQVATYGSDEAAGAPNPNNRLEGAVPGDYQYARRATSAVRSYNGTQNFTQKHRTNRNAT